MDTHSTPELSPPGGNDFHDLSKDTTDGPVPLIALEEDFFKVPGQAFAVLSFIDSSQYKGLRVEGAMSFPMHLIKVRGVFSTKDAAEKHVLQCQSIDTYFDYHIVETHKWTTVGAANASEQKWKDDTVDDAMHKYFEAENDTLANLQHRIQVSKDGIQRSDESSGFWEDSQGCKPIDPPTLPRDFKSMSLKDAATLAS